MAKSKLASVVLAALAGVNACGIQSVRAEVDMSTVKALIENVNAAFASYKAENDRALAELKANGHTSSDTRAKVDRIDSDVSEIQAAIDKLAVQMAGAQMGAGAQVKDKEYSDAFHAHFQKGELRASLNKGESEQGGYLAPVEWDRTITSKLVLVSPMRQICRVQPTGKSAYSKLFNMRGTESGWVGEEDNRPPTNGPAFKSLVYTTGEIYANPAATQQMLDDAEIDLEAWLAAEVQLEFAKQEGVGFLTGTGDKMPTGLLTYIKGGANASKHPLGAIQIVNSGDANAITSDAVFDLIYDLPSIYTLNARFTMNRTTQGKVRKLKDNTGNYLWQPSLVAGQPATLAGYAVTELPDMPDVAAGATPIMFGDFMQGYLINDRVGVRVLRDPYTNKPNVQFYTTKRVGGGLLTPECLRAMKVGATA
ncbi:phage major capsid protein [Burkholderia cenocepacia]|uniref:phage major capsid protein n=1 Tax=Burkholderia cenocepacia TaxID=95486 RepID=UPI002AB60D80|nr:phage major capsid protein [Burkholderia cenocepacia]